MRFDDLSKPVSDDKPAGPDLDEEMDPDYMNYVLVAPDRLPTGYLVQVPGSDERKPFDRSTIDLNKETDAIAGFLERTRDIRLLTLDARFNAAGGNVIGFAEATQGLATIVQTFWDEVHPKPPDGDMIVRQNTVESLDDLGQIVLHLQNAVVAGGGRTRPISLRHYLVATNKAEARSGEETVSLADISATMTAESSSARVTEVHGAIEAARTALETVRKTFMEKAGAEFTPAFPRLTELFQQTIEMIGAYRTDLVPPAAIATGTDEYGSEDGGTTLAPGAVKTHADATAALIAAENYFLRMEPSSPALILVHQSRMLAGRPMTFALEALMPDMSSRAALRFEGGYKFDIDLSRMKLVTDDALANGIPADDWDSLEQATGSSSTSDTGSSSDGGWGDSSSSSEGWGTPTEESPAEGALAESGELSGDAMGSSDTSDGSSEVAAGEASAEAAPEAAPAEDSWSAPVPARPEPQPEGPKVFSARTRGQAAELMQATEQFYRIAEPSSPIPLLLAKARSYVSKDFASILTELLPREPEAPNY